MVKQGYKQTEIGVIPEDWEVKELGECVDYIKGYPFKSKDYLTDGVRIIRISDTTYNSIKDESGIYISNTVASKLKNWAVKEGDIIVTTVGSKPPMYDSMVGKTIYIKKKYEGALLNQNAVLFRNKSNSFQVLLNNLFKQKRYIEYIESIFRGNANQASITLDELFKFQIPLPPLPEQEAIAEALSDADAWIESLEQLIAKKRLIKQGAMQTLLTPQEDWEVKKLGDCLNYIQPTPYLVKSTEYNPNNDIPVLTAGKTFILGYTDEDFGVFDKLPTIIFDDFTTASKYVNFPFKAKSSAMKMLVLKNDSNNLKFLYEIMQVLRFQVGDHKRHWIGEFQNLEIRVPSLSEQQRIATILSDMDAELEALEQQLDKAHQIKQGMMQELLTGRVRLL